MLQSVTERNLTFEKIGSHFSLSNLVVLTLLDITDPFLYFLYLHRLQGFKAEIIDIF